MKQPSVYSRSAIGEAAYERSMRPAVQTQRRMPAEAPAPPAANDAPTAHARQTVYERTRSLLREHFRISGMAGDLFSK